VIPCHGQAHYLADAIQSALDQDTLPAEIIVIDDGSPDDVAAVVRAFPDVQYLWQENSGLAAARNAGVRRAGGDHFVFLDADDRLRPTAISKGLEHVQTLSDASLVWGRCAFIDDQGDPCNWTGPDGSTLEISDRYSGSDPYSDLLRTCIVWTPGVAIFARRAFEECGLFNESVSPASDLEMYLRLARRSVIAAHDAIVLDYRCHSTSMTRDRSLMLDATLRVLEAERGHAASNPETLNALEDGIRLARAYWLVDEPDSATA
jgi:glycosyltransferase involved in cell wall biosynthesis